MQIFWNINTNFGGLKTNSGGNIDYFWWTKGFNASNKFLILFKTKIDLNEIFSKYLDVYLH